MKSLIFRYLNGLYQFYRRNDDAEMYVMGILILIEGVFIICVSTFFDFRIPTSEEIGNKWIVRMITGVAFWVVNIYIFGIRESVYSEYPPLSKRTTLLLTILYFAITFVFLFFLSENH